MAATAPVVATTPRDHENPVASGPSRRPGAGGPTRTCRLAVVEFWAASMRFRRTAYVPGAWSACVGAATQDREPSPKSQTNE